jgi:hypothetical protein
MSRPLIDNLTIEQLTRNINKALDLLEQLDKVLPGLTTLTDDDRKHSEGRIRGEGEVAALRAVLSAVDADPHYFKALADKDEGHDPNKLETQLLRDRLTKRELLARVQDAIDPLTARIGDTILRLGELTRPTTLLAYRIAKQVAEHDEPIKAQLAPALDYYSRVGQKAAETRAENKQPPPDKPTK